MVKINKFLLSLSLLLLGVSVLTPSFTCSSSVNVVNAKVDATNANTYYASLYDNSGNLKYKGDELLTQLRSIISTDTTNKSYDDLDDVYKTTDVDLTNSNYVIGYYTGQSLYFDFDGFDSSKGGVNREHVWCQSHFSAIGKDKQTTPYSDAHQVRPCEVSINSTRNNSFYEELTSSYEEDSYGNKYQGQELFYPSINYRGDVARICFYVATRYEGLSFVDGVTTIGTGAYTSSMGNISALMKWNILYKPTDNEIRRNEEVAKIQNNRNPFIDHPEFGVYIWEDFNTKTQNIVDTYTYDITFNTNGGSSLSVQEVLHGYKVNMPSTPSKSGYEFVGWYTNSSLTTPFDFSTEIYSDKTLYAKWNYVGGVDPIIPPTEEKDYLFENQSVETSLGLTYKIKDETGISYSSTFKGDSVFDGLSMGTASTSKVFNYYSQNIDASDKEVASAFGLKDYTGYTRGSALASDTSDYSLLFNAGSDSSGKPIFDNVKHKATQISLSLASWKDSGTTLTLTNATYNGGSTLKITSTSFNTYVIDVVDTLSDVSLVASAKDYRFHLDNVMYISNGGRTWEYSSVYLRFRTIIDSEVYSSLNAKQFGFLANTKSIDNSLKTKSEFDALINNDSTYLNLPINLNNVNYENNKYTLSGIIKNIPSVDFTTEVNVCFYYIDEDNNVIFSSCSSKSVSSMVNTYLEEKDELGLSSFEVEALTYFKSNYSL